jgi:hypothetical protein
LRKVFPALRHSPAGRFQLRHQSANLCVRFACDAGGIQRGHLMRRPANSAPAETYWMCQDAMRYAKVQVLRERPVANFTAGSRRMVWVIFDSP